MKLERPKPWWYLSRTGRVMALCPVCSARVNAAMLQMPPGVYGPPDQLRVRTARHSHAGGKRVWCEGGGVKLDLRRGTMVADRRGEPTPAQVKLEARRARQAEYERAVAEQWGSDASP